MTTRLRLSEANLALLPEAAGVVAAVRFGRVVQIDATGANETIRRVAERYLKGRDGRAIANASHVMYEVTNQPTRRAFELLHAYEIVHGRLPWGNRGSAEVTLS